MNLNATLLAQLVVFFILAWFTMRFVWPPIMSAIDERTRKIAEGLKASEESKEKLAVTEKKVEEEIRVLNEKIQVRLADAEKKASIIIDEAKSSANLEAQKIIENAKKEALNESQKMKDKLRLEVSTLAIKGAEQILEKEIDNKTHSDLLKKLEAEL